MMLLGKSLLVPGDEALVVAIRTLRGGESSGLFKGDRGE